MSPATWAAPPADSLDRSPEPTRSSRLTLPPVNGFRSDRSSEPLLPVRGVSIQTHPRFSAIKETRVIDANRKLRFRTRPWSMLRTTYGSLIFTSCTEDD
eukprot:760226-Hanusia_phi.AAC.13